MVLGLVAVLAVAGVALVSVPGLSKPLRSLFAATTIEIVPHEIKSGPLPITVTEKGALESSKNDDVSCQVEGQTTIIMILPEGTRVKKGELVCELDSAALRDSLTNQQIATQGADAAYQQAKLTREVAEIAVKEYVEGVYLQERATIKGEIKLAESDLARAEDRVDWATRMLDKGYVSKAQQVSEDLNFQKAKFALEQAQRKMKVLEDFTKAKTIKELKSEVEKAQSDELAKQQTLEAGEGQGREAREADRKLQALRPRRRPGRLRQRRRPVVRQQRSRRSRKGPRSASGRRSSACPTSPTCRSTPRSTSRRSTRSPRA